MKWKVVVFFAVLINISFLVYFSWEYNAMKKEVKAIEELEADRGRLLGENGDLTGFIVNFHFISSKKPLLFSNSPGILSILLHINVLIFLH